MKVNAIEKSILLNALETEASRVKRSINVQVNQSIKEILSADLAAINALAGRLSNEPVEVSK